MKPDESFIVTSVTVHKIQLRIIHTLENYGYNIFDRNDIEM